MALTERFLAGEITREQVEAAVADALRAGADLSEPKSPMERVEDFNRPVRRATFSIPADELRNQAALMARLLPNVESTCQFLTDGRTVALRVDSVNPRPGSKDIIEYQHTFLDV